MEVTAPGVAVERYLTRGDRCGQSAEELATQCERHVLEAARDSLPRALKRAKRFAKRAGDDTGPLGITAYRCLARITHMSGQHAAALDAYLHARKLARKDRLLCARIDRALIDVYMYLGEFREAQRASQRAIRVFSECGADSDLAQTRVNYANLLHRRDRHREAERYYQEAAAYFESTHNALAAARCHYNRANVLVQMFNFPTAETLYREAEERYTAEGYSLDANDARYGRAWLRMLSGEFHTALLDLTACETVYREGGDLRGEALCQLDRCEVYLGLGLHAEALEASRAVERTLRRLKLRYEGAKASLFRAQAALAMNARQEAREALERARLAFAADKNTGFQGVTELVGAELLERDSRERTVSLASARRLFARAELPFWRAVCDVKQAADPARSAPVLKRLANNPAAAQVPHLFAAWQTAAGDYHFYRGDDTRAIRHWQRAADRLDEVRASLPPVELRTAFTRKERLPHARLISAETRRDLLQAAVWSERHKTAGVWSPVTGSIAVRRSVEASLNALARQVAALASQVDEKPGARGLSPRLRNANFRTLQRELREKLIEVEERDKGGLAAGLAQQLVEISNQLPVVQFHVADDRVMVFVHDKGETSLRTFHGGRTRVREALRRWRFILESELLSGRFGGTSVAPAEQALWTELGEYLWRPLDVRSSSRQVLLLPEGELSNLPWQALLVDGRPLGEHYEFITSPSFRHHIAAKAIRVRTQRMKVFRGKAERLDHVDAEVEALVRMVGRNADYLRACKRNDWPTDGSYRIWHFAGHARLRSDNPFYSSLELTDGPLFAVDFRVRKCKVHLVTLAACRSGEQIALPGEEATGLVRSLLEMGARNVIAGHWPVSDQTTAEWMELFYRKYLDGDPPSAAAQFASCTLRESYPSAYHWAAFSVFGAGD